jgi:hypothetical protein
MPITPSVIDNPIAKRKRIIPKEIPFNRFMVSRSIAESTFVAILNPSHPPFLKGGERGFVLLRFSSILKRLIKARFRLTS